jgi:hypothetical protein
MRLSVYKSASRPDCTSIKNTLKKQGFAPEVDKGSDGWCVFVPPHEYNRAHELVWGDETPRE